MVKFIVLILGFLAYASFNVKHTFAADVYDARCTEAKNETIVAGNVTSIITSMDSCDTSKNLACNNGRCACKDPNKHVYTTREFKRSELPSYLIPLIPQSRSKRSPGKGGKPKGSKSRGVGTGTAIAGDYICLGPLFSLKGKQLLTLLIIFCRRSCGWGSRISVRKSCFRE